MADEAKLIIDLIDRSGQAGVSSTGPGQAGVAEVPGSTLSKEFQTKVTEQGIKVPEAPPSSAPTTPPAPIPTVAPTATSTPTLDKTFETVKQLVQADPNITAEELHKSLGFTPAEAQALLDRAHARQTQTQQTTSAPPFPTGQPVPAVDINQGAMAEGMERLRQQTDPWQRGLRNIPRDASVVESEEEPDNSSIEAAQSAISMAGSILGRTGPIGAAIGSAASTVTAQFPALGAALAGVAPAIPYLAAGAAIAGIPLAGMAVTANEFERARALTGNLSPEAAMAQAEADTRRIMANIETAQRLGDEVADYIESRSRISTAGQRLRDIISEPILQNSNEYLGVLSKSAELIAKGADQTPIAVDAMQAALKGLITWQQGGFNLFMEQLNKRLEKLVGGGTTTPFDWFGTQNHLEPRTGPFAGGRGDEVEKDQFNITNMPGL